MSIYTHTKSIWTYTREAGYIPPTCNEAWYTPEPVVTDDLLLNGDVDFVLSKSHSLAQVKPF